MNLRDELYDLLEDSELQAPLINIGFGEDLTVRELAELIRDLVGFKGRLVFDASKPHGTPRKLLDMSRLSDLGWKSRIPLREGIDAVYREYLAAHTVQGVSSQPSA